MKKLTLLVCISLAFVMGCKKDSSNSTNPSTPIAATQTPLHRVTMGSSGITSITGADASALQVHLQKNNGPTFASNTPHQAIGHYTLAPGGPASLTVDQNEVSNNGGIHGTITWTGRFGVQMDAACLQVVGNLAVCMGVITSVQNDAGYPQVFAVGNTIIYEIVDNGEGSKAPADVLNDGFFYWTPEFGPLPCGADFTVLDWSSVWDPILKDGNIQVK